MSLIPLTLFPGPKLILKLSGNEDIAHDVTDRASEFLFTRVKVDTNVVLWDILKLLAPPVMRAVFRGNYVDELLQEAALGPLIKQKLAYERIEWIELNQFWYFNRATSEFNSVGQFGVTGKGICQPEDVVEQGTVVYKKGDRIQWSVSTSSVREFLLLPVQLNSRVALCAGDVHAEDYGDILQTGINTQISLGVLIHSLLWELSWHGSPEQRDERVGEFQKMTSESNSDAAKLATKGASF